MISRLYRKKLNGGNNWSNYPIFQYQFNCMWLLYIGFDKELIKKRFGNTIQSIVKDNRTYSWKSDTFLLGLHCWTLQRGAEDNWGHLQLRPVDLLELVWQEVLHPPPQPGEAPPVKAGNDGNKNNIKPSLLGWLLDFNAQPIM